MTLQNPQNRFEQGRSSVTTDKSRQVQLLLINSMTTLRLYDAPLKENLQVFPKALYLSLGYLDICQPEPRVQTLS